MWPFTPRNRQETPSEPPASPGAPLPTTPADAGGAAFATQGDLEVLRLEWAEVLDKLARWTSRQAARERRRVESDLNQLAEGSEALQDAPGDPNGGGPGVDAPPSLNGPQRAALKAQLRARITPRR
jgi:hypothetical protein